VSAAEEQKRQAHLVADEAERFAEGLSDASKKEKIRSLAKQARTGVFVFSVGLRVFGFRCVAPQTSWWWTQPPTMPIPTTRLSNAVLQRRRSDWSTRSERLSICAEIRFALVLPLCCCFDGSHVV